MKKVLLLLVAAAAFCGVQLKAQSAEISVSGNAIYIADGDNTPSAADHTDMGHAEMCSGTAVRSFTIENTGTSDLHIYGVSFTGTLGISYLISAAPASIVAPGGSTEVEVTFDPFAAGPRDVVLVINSDDPDEGVYNFTLMGTGDPDTTAPNMLCKNATIYLDSSGTALLYGSDIDDGSHDACSAISLGISADTLHCNQLGANSVVLSGWDPSGNLGTCVSTVMVVDTIAPDAKCKNIIAYLSSTGTVKVVPTALNNGSTDNCGIDVYLTKAVIYDCSMVGPHPKVFSMRDASGNLSECVGIVTVADSTRPVAICRDRIIYVGQTISPANINNGSHDACGITLAFGTSSFKGTAFCYDSGVNLVPLLVTDPSGNVGTCISHVTVLDTVIPVASCKPVEVYLDASGHVSIAEDAVNWGSTDNCTALNYNTDLTDFSCNEIGTQVVTLTVTDPAGNTSSCMTAVFVMDTLAPVLTCSSVTVQLPAAGFVVLTPEMAGAFAEDNCSLEPLVMNRDSLTCADLGVVNVTLTATDGSGNISTCISVVNLVDTLGLISVLDLGPDLGWCSGDVYTFHAGAGYSSYVWSTGATSASLTVSLPGTYSVTATSPYGCESADTVVVLPYTLADGLIVSAGAASLCGTGSVVLSAPSGYIMPVWSTGYITPSITVTTGGWYSLTATDPMTGCRRLDSIFVASGSPVTAAITYDGATLSASPTGAGYTYQWFLDGLLIAGETDSVLVPTSTGDYSVEVTNIGGCSDADTLAVLLTHLTENLFSGLEVFPNPSNGNVTIRPLGPIHTEVTIRVTDMSGRVLVQYSRSQLVSDEPLSLGQVAAGVYHLELITGEAKHHVKLVVE